mmetsp:Transcript_24974/g.58090  ORF Transcript_24974/g.58090 Transcript_24974/m.58090 type:complete len:171 (-) Transcript_24974:131-643(-)
MLCRAASRFAQQLPPRFAELSQVCCGVLKVFSGWLRRGSPWPPFSLECAAVASPGTPLPWTKSVANTIDQQVGGAAAAGNVAAELFGFAVLQKKMWRGVHGTFNPSLWRWYHRHGYWATRRKHIDFGTKRKYRYNQVGGDGRRSSRYQFRFGQFWMDKSYYKPFKNYCRF